MTCKTDEGIRSVPLEDVAAVVITSFSASIHSKLLLEAARHGVGLVLCEEFKPACLVLPANRATDTLLTRAQIDLSESLRKRLWRKTIDAKVRNQASLARHLSPTDPSLPKLDVYANGRHADKESTAARLFWGSYARSLHLGRDFRRGRNAGGINPLLNYGYAVLLSTVLQKCFALGIDPTFGIFHKTREKATPLAYDLMEPFRPCVDWRVAQWIQQNKDAKEYEVSLQYRRWVTGFPLVRTEHMGLELSIQGCIEGVIRSFRKALIAKKTTPYKPWIQGNSKWDG